MLWLHCPFDLPDPREELEGALVASVLDGRQHEACQDEVCQEEACHDEACQDEACRDEACRDEA